jgi:putative thiamine transport system ATP-binding protein
MIPREARGRLDLDKVTLWIGPRQLTAPLTLSVGAGTIASIMGPSGSGKSALLAWIAGVPYPAFRARGRVYLNGRDVTDMAPEDRRIGLVAQDDRLFRHLSVGENLAMALASGIPVAEKHQLVEKSLAELDLAGFAGRDVAGLSGGERARVSLLRAMMAEPLAVLLDEPFSKLDSPLRTKIRHGFFGYVKSRGVPSLIVTHDRADALAAGGPVHDLTGPAGIPKNI